MRLYAVEKNRHIYSKSLQSLIELSLTMYNRLDNALCTIPLALPSLVPFRRWEEAEELHTAISVRLQTTTFVGSAYLMRKETPNLQEASSSSCPMASPLGTVASPRTSVSFFSSTPLADGCCAIRE